MKRDDEEFCKAQFDTFVKRFFAPSQVTWHEVAQQHEPPDYYLLLDNTKYAVEVTTLVESVRVGTSSQMPPSAVHRFLEQFVDAVEEAAKTEGYLRGYYLVEFTAPIDDFTVVREGIRDGLLEYIRTTSGLESAPREKVFERIVSQRMPQQCWIRKVGSRPSKVKGGGPVWTKWEGEAAEEICGLLGKSLSGKAGKLKDVGDPIVLLLLDEYRLADRHMFEGCVRCLPWLAHFHTVFVVQGRESAFLLHSQNPDWLRE